MIELFSTMPLMYLAERKRDIENFKRDIFPQLSVALEDMGLDGSVSFSTTASGPNVGYDTVFIKTRDKAKKQATVTVKFASATPRNEYIVKLKSPDGLEVINTAAVRSEDDLVDMIESFFAMAYGELITP